MKDLDELRRSIDETDEELLRLFSKRLDIAREIGAYKRRHALPISVPQREREAFRVRNRQMHKTPYGYYTKSFLLPLMSISKAVQRAGQNVYLIGMPGSGKSQIARALGGCTDRTAVDTDEEIVKAAGMSIAEIFQKEGESGFRAREHAALLDVAERGYSIVATGGGILTLKENLALLRMSGRLVFLDVPLEKLLKRDLSGRPLFRDPADIERLYHERRAGYMQAADMTLDPEAGDTLDILKYYCME